MRLRPALIPTLVWACAMLGFWWPQIASGFAMIPDLLNDPRLVNYTLEHGYRWVMRFPLHADFWQTPLFYPYPNITAFTDVLVGSGPLYWFWRWLRFEPDTAFQLWMMVCGSLNFAAAYWLLKRAFGVTTLAASTGALLIAFGSPATSRVWHPQLLPMYCVLIGLLASFEVFSGPRETRIGRQRRKWIAVFLAAVVVQVYTAFYAFFFFGLFAIAALSVSVAHREARTRLADFFLAHGGFTAASGAVACLLVAPLAFEYLQTAHDLGTRPFGHRFIPRPESWFLLGTDNLLFGWLQREGGPFAHLDEMEHSAGVGFVTGAIGLFAWFRARGRNRGVWLLGCSTLVVFVVSTLFGGFTLWRWVHDWFPAADAIRVLCRISMIASVTIPIGVAWLIDDWTRSKKTALAILIGTVCVAEQVHAPFPQTGKLEVRALIASLAAQVDRDCPAFALAYVGPTGYRYEDDDAAWVGLATGKPTVNGRYGNNPKNWKLFRHQSDGDVPSLRRLQRATGEWLAPYGIAPDTVCWITYP